MLKLLRNCRSPLSVAAYAGCLALLPVTAFAVFAFGLTAIATLCTAVISCVVTEHVLCRLSEKETTVSDWSVVLTGLLYGLTLPPGLALWMVAAGGVIAVGASLV